MQKTSVLLVENEKTIIASLEFIFKKAGYFFLGAVGTGEECLAMIEKNTPDIILMDIFLDGPLNGIDTARTIKRDYNIPIIFITAFASNELLKNACITDQDALLIKPFREKDILLQMEISLNKFSLLKHNEILTKHFQEEVMDNCMKSDQIQKLLDASTMINSTLNINEIKTKTIEAAMAIAGAEAASLLLIDELTDDLFFDVALGEKGANIRDIHISKESGIAGTAIQNNKTIIVNNPQESEYFNNSIDIEHNFMTRNIICIPIRQKTKLIGVLEVINKKNSNFTDADSNLLTSLTNQIAVALDNANLYEKQKKIFYSIITALAEMIDKKDIYTGGHSKRVQEYSMILGKALKLNDHDINRLELASILHDIGKIGVTDHILNKESNLTDEEFQIIKQHPVFGNDILKHFPDLTEIIPGIRHHHERYDGEGYPDRLKGQEIDITARIIAVADAYDAMLSGRSYKRKIEHQDALSEIKRCCGSQFDPVIAETFYYIFKDKQTDEGNSSR